jgi:hypothetical protein
MKKGYKQCPCCIKPAKANLKNFYRNAAKPDGLSTNCKKHQKEYVTDYRSNENNRSYISKYSANSVRYKTGKISFGTFVENIEMLKSRYGIGTNARSFI